MSDGKGKALDALFAFATLGVLVLFACAINLETPRWYDTVLMVIWGLFFMLFMGLCFGVSAARQAGDPSVVATIALELKRRRWDRLVAAVRANRKSLRAALARDASPYRGVMGSSSGARLPSSVPADEASP